jgi:hypothetical protein
VEITKEEFRLKRFAIAIATVVVGLVAASAAFAAVNNYTASYKFSGSKGTKAKPAKLAFTQTINVAPGTSGQRTGVLHQITTKITGAKLDVSGLPTCSSSKINSAQSDSACSKKALIAKGYIEAQLGSASDPTAAGSACDPELDVWNGGKGKLIFFFVDTGSHQCLNGALHTGQVPPWTASYKQSGTNLNVTIPIPNTVDYPLGTSGGEVGSLSKVYLKWASTGLQSTGCSGSQRAYTFGFKASAIGSTSSESGSVSGKAACG